MFSLHKKHGNMLQNGCITKAWETTMSVAQMHRCSVVLFVAADIWTLICCFLAAFYEHLHHFQKPDPKSSSSSSDNFSLQEWVSNGILSLSALFLSPLLLPDHCTTATTSSWAESKWRSCAFIQVKPFTAFPTPTHPHPPTCAGLLSLFLQNIQINLGKRDEDGKWMPVKICLYESACVYGERSQSLESYLNNRSCEPPQEVDNGTAWLIDTRLLFIQLCGKLPPRWQQGVSMIFRALPGFWATKSRRDN